MNTHLRASESRVGSTTGKLDDAAIRDRADLVGKQLGEGIANLLFEITIAILSTKNQDTPARQKEILTADEVADILRISKAKVYRMMQVGEIASVKFGRTSRVRLEDLNNFIQQHLE
jgi:excisionase family DNA binding protein